VALLISAPPPLLKNMLKTVLKKGWEDSPEDVGR
jgi:hypothetical protein